MKTIKRDVVAAIIRSKDNKILMLKKNPALGGVYLDSWHIPGGGREEKETHEQALLRELQEELGIDASPFTRKLIDNKGKDISKRTHTDISKDVLVDMSFYVYEITIEDKHSEKIVITLSEEHEEYRWFSMHEIQSVKITPPSLRLFRKIGYI